MKGGLRIIFLVSLATFTGLELKAAELVRNGRFEEGLKEWTWMTYGGAKATANIEMVAGCEGKKALMLSSRSDFQSGVSGVLHQRVSGLVPNTTYKVTTRFLGKQIGPAWIGGGEGWDIRGYFWLGDVDEWQQTTVNFTTKADQTTFDLRIAVDGKTQALWVDEVRIVNVATEQVDQVQAKLQTLIMECEKSLNAKTVNPQLVAMLRGNIKQAQEQLNKLVVRKTDLDNAGSFMSKDEQTMWIQTMSSLQMKIDGTVLWTQDPMKDLKPTMMPLTLTSTEKLTWQACVNEHAPIVVNITNLVGTPDVDWRVVLTTFVPQGSESVPHRLGDWNPDEAGVLRAYKGTGGQIPASQVVLREAVPIRKASGEWTCDPLSKLDEASRMIVPVGQTRQLWLDVVTDDLKPGIYQATLQIIPTDPLRNQVARTIALELKILPVVLSKHAPIAIFNFDYGLSANPKCLTDMLEHRANVFDVLIRCPISSNPMAANFKFFDSYIANAKKYNAKLMVENATVQQTGWKAEYEPWFRMMFKYLRDAGLRDDQFFLHLYDEQLSPEFLIAAKAVKAIDPKVRIIANPFQIDYDEKTIEAFMPYIDIWSPKIGLLQYWMKNKPKIVEMIRTNKKQLWFYDCNSGKSIETTMSNRTFGWLAFRYDVQGLTAWTFATTDYADVWGASHSWEKVYPLADGNVLPSRRWEAWREGIEDYCLLAILRQKINDKSSSDVQALQAKKLIDEAVTSVSENNQDADLLAKKRIQLLELARKLYAGTKN